jgi:hypothetical protein
LFCIQDASFDKKHEHRTPVDPHREFSIVQHMSGACRAARTGALMDLPAAAVLRRLDDVDIDHCREARRKYRSMFSRVLVLVVIGTMVSMDAFGEQLMEIMIPSFWSSIMLFFATIYLLSFAAFLATLFVCVALYLYSASPVKKKLKASVRGYIARISGRPHIRVGGGNHGKLLQETAASAAEKQFVRVLHPSSAVLQLLISILFPRHAARHQAVLERQESHCWGTMNYLKSHQGCIDADTETSIHKPREIIRRWSETGESVVPDGVKGRIIVPDEISRMRASKDEDGNGNGSSTGLLLASEHCLELRDLDAECRERIIFVHSRDVDRKRPMAVTTVLSEALQALQDQIFVDVDFDIQPTDDNEDAMYALSHKCLSWLHAHYRPEGVPLTAAEYQILEVELDFLIDYHRSYSYSNSMTTAATTPSGEGSSSRRHASLDVSKFAKWFTDCCEILLQRRIYARTLPPHMHPVVGADVYSQMRGTHSPLYTRTYSGYPGHASSQSITQDWMMPPRSHQIFVVDGESSHQENMGSNLPGTFSSGIATGSSSHYERPPPGAKPLLLYGHHRAPQRTFLQGQTHIRNPDDVMSVDSSALSGFGLAEDADLDGARTVTDLDYRADISSQVPDSGDIV